MEMMMIGPLKGADARAYFQPPAAASAVPRATLARISVRRNGRRDISALSELIELPDHRGRLRPFGRDGIDIHDGLEVLACGKCVAFVHRDSAERKWRLAPGRVHLRRPLVRFDRL